MKKRLLFWTTLLVIFSGCEKNNLTPAGGGGSDNPSKPQEAKLQYAVLNINDTTPYADIMLACSNGSYMICDVNHDDQCGMLYFNTSSNKDIDAGYFIYVDATGTPMMLRTNKGEYYFRNVTENGCDLAYQPYGGEPIYYWDVQLNEDAEQNQQSFVPRKGKTTWGETVTSPFTTWWSDVTSFDWTWDKHQRKAILPFLAKVTSFGITAVSAVGDGDVIGVLTTLYDESLKSGLVDSSLVKFIDAYDAFSSCKDVYDKFKEGVSPDDAKGFAISYIASKLNEYADEALENSATFDEISWEIFNHPENHISLSRYVVNVPQSGGIAMIKVTAQEGWYIEKSTDWISYSTDYNYINLTIHANEDASAREYTLYVFPPSGAQPARLTVKQDGSAFAISPTEITFTGKEAHNAILVQASDKVKSWKVKSCPNWLDYEVSSMTVWLDTKSSMSDKGDQSGTVVIEATFHEGGTVTQSCAVTWYPDDVDTSWDGTSWLFTGTITGDDGSSGTTSMRLDIHSMEAHSATVSIGGYSNLSATVYNNGAGSVRGSFGADGMTGTYTVTLTGETTATCTLRMTIAEAGSGGGTMQGTKQ